MNQVREISRSYTVELAILNNTNSKCSFGDNETMLDDKIITGLSVLPNWIGAAPSGRAMLNYIDVMRGFLTLCDHSKTEINKQLPLELLLRNDPILHFKPRVVNIRNSYVDFPLINNFIVPADGLSLVFVFYYEDLIPGKHRVNANGEVERIGN